MQKLINFTVDLSAIAILLISSAIILLAVVWTGYHLYLGLWGQEPVVVASTKAHPRPTTYQVMPGDTVWSIYVAYYKGCDWDEVRYKIGQANGLRNDTLYPYEIIKLPEVSR